jgi:hypothetical protein
MIEKVKIGRNDLCSCGSGIKYKNCCLKEKVETVRKQVKYSINDIIFLLQTALENISLADKEIGNINIKLIKILNNDTLDCQFYSKRTNSTDIKMEIGSVMSAIYGFLNDDIFDNIKLNYYAVRAIGKEDNELLYAISSIDTASLIANGKSIEWLRNTIFEENTQEYRLGMAKRLISEIENSLRHIISNRLYKKYGHDWFNSKVDGKIRKNVIHTYKNQFGEIIDDGKILIDYTYILQIKDIILKNWNDFSDLFTNKSKLDESFLTLNNIRREESHNRLVSESDLKMLKEIYEYILTPISNECSGVLPLFLIENWKIQVKEIMQRKFLPSKSAEEISTQKDNLLRFEQSLQHTRDLIMFLEDKEISLNSVVTPVQKKIIHNNLTELIKKEKNLHEEMYELGKVGDIKGLDLKEKEIKLHNLKMNEFAKELLK